VRSRSPLRRRPDDATWPTAHDVSQRAEPDVRPLDHAASAFIAEEARRKSSWQVMCLLSIKYALSTPLTSDVSSQHLMCPVRSGGRRYARAAAYTVLIITRMLPVKLPLHVDATQAADIRAQGDCTGDQH
jgi:hypothetical protein